MAKLIVTRSSEYMNRARAIGIYLDGEKLGTIANGQTQEFDIPDGEHVFKSKIDWCGSADFPFFMTHGDTKYITVSSFGYRYNFMLISAIIIVLHLLLNWFFKIEYLVWPIFAIGLILTYFLTFGRKKYLVVQEKSFF